jgi:hypothetical protein
MKQLDRNDDGYISLDEFHILMEHTLRLKADHFDKANNWTSSYLIIILNACYYECWSIYKENQLKGEYPRV